MAMNPTPYSETTDKHGYNDFITAITLPTGNKYEIVDEHAREILNTMSGYTDFLGVTTTPIDDGSTTSVILINNVATTATKGDIVLRSITGTAGMMAKEFIFDGSKWQLFGDISTQNLGSLAYKNSASGSYTAVMSVSGTIGTISVTGNFTPVVTLINETTTLTLSTTSTGNTATGYRLYQPSGSVTVPFSTSSISYLRAVAGNTLISSVSAAGTAATMTNGINIAQVTTNCLVLSWLKYATANGVASSSSVNALQSAKITNPAFTGDQIFFSPITVSIPTGTTANAQKISATGTAVTTVSQNKTGATVTVS